jgi:hypothetical protein
MKNSNIFMCVEMKFIFLIFITEELVYLKTQAMCCMIIDCNVTGVVLLLTGVLQKPVLAT